MGGIPDFAGEDVWSETQGLCGRKDTSSVWWLRMRLTSQIAGYVPGGGDLAGARQQQQGRCGWQGRQNMLRGGRWGPARDPGGHPRRHPLRGVPGPAACGRRPAQVPARSAQLSLHLARERFFPGRLILRTSRGVCKECVTKHRNKQAQLEARIVVSSMIGARICFMLQ